MSTNVLVVGSGGREHALAWKIKQSPRIGKLYVAPGNGGTREIAENVPIKAMDINALVQFAKTHDISLTVVGPDDPLAAGVVDAFQATDLPVFGPTQQAAAIESSKAIAKDIMRAINVPTASFRIFFDHEKAQLHVQSHTLPMVIKASGLALGKGAYVCHTLNEAENALKKIMVERVHGAAGDFVVVEEFLYGQEISIHAFCDGYTFRLFPPAQDHKPIGDNNEGSNTGGMGTIAPVPWVGQNIMERIRDLIVHPTLDKLIRCNRRFTGLLYPGIMMTDQGPKVLEFNARFGDPETQVYMRLLETDLLDILEACTRGQLGKVPIKWRDGFAACIVLASEGYPGDYRKGFAITGLKEAQKVPGVEIFHAGTAFDGELKTSGGRVLGVSAVGDTLQAALNHAYTAVGAVCFEGMYFRRDIGHKALGK